MSIANKRLNSTSSASFPTSAASPSASNLNPFTQKQAHGKSMHSQASTASTARPRKNSARTSSSAGMSTSTAPTTESSNGTKLRIMTKGVRNEGVIAVNGGENSSGKEGRKVEEPCVKSTRYILKKYNHHPPSLTIHLHPSHFRFDGQDGSFPYTSEMRVFLKHVREGTVPHDMMEQLLNSGVRWYEDCLVVRIVDHKSCGKKKRRLKVEDKGTAATGDTATATEGDANKKTDGNGAGTGKKASGDAQNGQKGSTPAPAPSKGEEEEDDEEGDELEDRERERLAMTLNSIHNYNQHVAPSPYAPFPFDQAPTNGHASQGQMGSRQPSSQPSLPPQQQQSQPARPETSLNESKPPSSTPATSKPSSNAPKKPKVFTTVLHPTAQSRAAELFVLYHTPAYKRPYLAAAAAAAAARDGDAGGDLSLPSATLAALSAPSSHPQSPAPPSATAQNDSSLMPPPSKRQRMLIEPHERLEFEAKLINATAPAICLRLVQNAKEADALIRSLEPETNRAKPLSPKLRKRTVAELAADEAHAAEEEKYMLIMDERLDVPTTSASSLLSKSGITKFDSESGVSGFAFARFKALETIRAQHEENKKREQAERAAQEAERKVQQREAEERRRQVELRQAEEQEKQEERYGAQMAAQQRAAAAQMAAAQVQRAQQEQQAAQQRAAQQQAQRGQTPGSVSAGPASALSARRRPSAQTVHGGMPSGGSMRGTPTPRPVPMGLSQSAAGGVQASPMSHHGTPQQQHGGVARRGSAATAGSPGIMPASNNAGIPPGMNPATAVAMGLNGMNMNGYPMGVGMSPHGGNGTARSTPQAGAGSPLQPGGQIGTPTPAGLQHHGHPGGNLNPMGHPMIQSRSTQSTAAHGHSHGLTPAAAAAAAAGMIHGPSRNGATSIPQATPAMSQATPAMRNATPIQPMSHASPRTPGLVQGTPGMVHPGINIPGMSNPALSAAAAAQLNHSAAQAQINQAMSMLNPHQRAALMAQQQQRILAANRQQGMNMQQMTPTQLKQLQQRNQFLMRQQQAARIQQQQQQQQQQQRLQQQFAVSGAAQGAQGFPPGMRPSGSQMGMVGANMNQPPGMPQGIPHGANPQQMMANGIPTNNILLQRQLQARQQQQAAAAAAAAAANGAGNFMPTSGNAGVAGGIPTQMQMNAMNARLQQRMFQQQMSPAEQEQVMRQVQQQQQQLQQQAQQQAQQQQQQQQQQHGII